VAGAWEDAPRVGGVTHRYISGLLKSVPALAALIVRKTRDSIELSNGVIAEVITARLCDLRAAKVKALTR